MPTDYVEDYEAVTGKKREFYAVAKVVTAPEYVIPVFNAAEAETKAK